jgi:hypothetical protein
MRLTANTSHVQVTSVHLLVDYELDLTKLACQVTGVMVARDGEGLDALRKIACSLDLGIDPS